MIDIKLMASSDTMMRLVDIAGGDCDFVSDHDKDYSMVFGEARMRLRNTRYAVYLCVFVCVYACVQHDVSGLVPSKSCSALVAPAHTCFSCSLSLKKHTQMKE